MTARITHWTNGAETAGDSGRTGAVYNPATGVQTAEVDLASRAEVDAAVAAGDGGGRAAGARPRWPPAPASCSRFRELLAASMDELAAIVTAEHGKVLSDAKGEIAARPGERRVRLRRRRSSIKGGFSEQAGTGVDVYSIRQPLGVVAGITPFNFPVMVPLWMCANAIATRQRVHPQAEREGPVGRRCSWPGCGRRPGCPTASSPSLQGDKEAVDAILDHPGIAAVSFVGSTPIARYIYETGTAQRQAGPGARRREEPHARPARRRRRHGRRRGRLRGVRRGRRALHGHLRRGRGRRRGRPAGRRDRRPAAQARASATAPTPTPRWVR